MNDDDDDDDDDDGGGDGEDDDYDVHTEDAPLWPIEALKVTPTYGLVKQLLRRLNFLTADSDTKISSSTQFLEKLEGASLLPNNFMSLFDVTSLFTSIRVTVLGLAVQQQAQLSPVPIFGADASPEQGNRSYGECAGDKHFQ
ncbi:unnamed protein product [Schistocephalus solidus]|uniref:Uncharacterized protein n=1 Tax=Schistocephalus solidus TaxID=70667 RepID=A0A183ST84_SCHSO|nr:unnamed protein product [Schistocephalus solidus]